jgi:hypothetical protein
MKAQPVVGMLSIIAITNFVIPTKTREKVWEILSYPGRDLRQEHLPTVLEFQRLW